LEWFHFCLAQIALNLHYAYLPRVEHNASVMNRRAPITFFSICAVVDFVIGLAKWHSVVAAIVAVVCGLPLTGLLFLILGASWKGNGDSGESGT